MPSKTIETPENQSQTLEDLKIQLIQEFQELKKQSRDVEDNWKKEMHELKQENNVLKAKINHFEKDDQKARDEIQSLKTRIQQLELNDFTRQKEYVKQNQFEENMKHLIGKTSDLDPNRFPFFFLNNYAFNL